MCHQEEVIYAFLTDKPKKGNKKTITKYWGTYPTKGDAVRIVGNGLMKIWGHIGNKWKENLAMCIFGTKEDIVKMDVVNPIGFPEVKSDVKI